MEVRDCWLLFGVESLVFQVAIQKIKIKIYIYIYIIIILSVLYGCETLRNLVAYIEGGT